MHPRLFQLFVLGLSVVLSLIVAFAVGLIVKTPLFAADPDSALLLIWSLCIPAVYAMMRFQGLKLGLPTALALGLAAAAVWTRVLGDVTPVFVELPVGLVLIAVVFEVFWGAPRISILRNLLFGVMAAMSHTIAGAASAMFSGGDITALSLLHGFRVGLLAALAISVGLTLAERIYIPLAWRWGIPGVFLEEDEQPETAADEDDND